MMDDGDAVLEGKDGGEEVEMEIRTVGCRCEAQAARRLSGLGLVVSAKREQQWSCAVASGRFASE